MRRQRRFAAAALGMLVLVAGCSSGGSGSNAVNADTDTTTTGAAAATASDTTDVCDLFQDIAEHAQAAKTTPGDPSATFTPEQWEQKIETTARIVDVAPAEYRDEAETYLELVKARSELAAEHGYGPIPAEARTAFASAHGAEQRAANVLIASVRETCDLEPLT